MVFVVAHFCRYVWQAVYRAPWMVSNDPKFVDQSLHVCFRLPHLPNRFNVQVGLHRHVSVFVRASETGILL